MYNVRVCEFGGGNGIVCGSRNCTIRPGNHKMTDYFEAMQGVCDSSPKFARGGEVCVWRLGVGWVVFFLSFRSDLFSLVIA